VYAYGWFRICSCITKNGHYLVVEEVQLREANLARVARAGVIEGRGGGGDQHPIGDLSLLCPCLSVAPRPLLIWGCDCGTRTTGDRRGWRPQSIGDQKEEAVVIIMGVFQSIQLGTAPGTEERVFDKPLVACLGLLLRAVAVLSRLAPFIVLFPRPAPEPLYTLGLEKRNKALPQALQAGARRDQLHVYAERIQHAATRSDIRRRDPGCHLYFLCLHLCVVPTRAHTHTRTPSTHMHIHANIHTHIQRERERHHAHICIYVHTYTHTYREEERERERERERDA